MEGAHKTALITGASSGIGYELGKLFARDHYNLVIVARHEDGLKKAAETFYHEGAPGVIVMPIDLTLPGAPEAVYMETRERGIVIDVLVNNAGVGEHGFFSETSIDKEMEIIQLNIVALVQFTKLYLKDMLTRNEGRVLQTASIASYQPTPLLAVYAATKAFVLSFTDALINELKETGVTMTALIPAATDTDFFHKAHAENTAAAQHAADPADVARIGYEGLMKGEHHAVAGAGVQAQIAMSTMLPNEAVAAMARKQMEPKK